MLSPIQPSPTCTGYFLANSLEDLSASKKVPALPFSFSRREVCILFVTRTNSHGGHSRYHSCPLNMPVDMVVTDKQGGVSTASVCSSTAQRASAMLQCRWLSYHPPSEAQLLTLLSLDNRRCITNVRMVIFRNLRVFKETEVYMSDNHDCVSS